MDTSASANPQTTASSRTRAKAIVAIAAGAALLLGGGGTLAFWSTAKVLDVGTLTSGDLNLTVTGTPAWTLQGVADSTATPVTDPSAVKIVPGDVLVMTQEVALTVKGDTIKAALDVEPATVPAGVTAKVTATGVDPTALSQADDGKTVTVTVTITFPGSTANRDLVNTSFDFGDLTLTLSQLSA